ncbi:LADA_0E07998g1_1 [Lachancea dasiensis]|uniref:LADA_0E07998g1_1 n=1 Tax=Lachancea dasiensis TaxID=1072105 RepID=A0A1G4JD42_9SACH|nr:LADA_0E07998g1_1 [Lachancea dasiensis]
MLRSNFRSISRTRTFFRQKGSLGASFSRQDFDHAGFDLDHEAPKYSSDTHQFGQVVENITPEIKMDVVSREDMLRQQPQSPYRDSSGELIQGKNAKESRLLPETLLGRAPRDQIELNTKVADAIRKNILSLHIPSNLRRSAGNKFVELKQSRLHRATKTSMEVDSHIASIFLQNYASIFQSLSELKKRLRDDFKPDKVLDVGYGPATGMVALNDLLGAEFRPSVKDAVIFGHSEMKKRAKIMLSRQLNEVSHLISEQETRSEHTIDGDEDDLVGEVMIKKIRTHTTLRDEIPVAKRYDLIILTHQLLQTEEKFPYEVDTNIELFLKLLAPGGHIVLIERGNPMGFEIIARARQVAVRPENFLNEHGKIPRPWGRGFHSANPDIERKWEGIDSKDSKFEEEIEKQATSSGKEESYHLKIIAPCPHQRKCPLQIGKPQYYEYGEGKNLNFCNFQKSVLRPRYSIELKKGKILATPWENNHEPIGIKGLAKKGTGRPNGRNFEILNYSYLIMERSHTDSKTVELIHKQREEQNLSYDVGSLGNNTPDTWPRIIRQPIKRKGHVVMDLCGSSGLVEKWTVPKSFSKEIYHDARKAMKGDLWALDAKTKAVAMSGLNVKKLEQVEQQKLREARRLAKRRERELDEAVNAVDYGDSPLSTEESVGVLATMYGDQFNKNWK